MTLRDCYIILGVSPNTTVEAVRRRYRALARQYDPDHHPDDPEAAAQFRQLAKLTKPSNNAAPGPGLPPRT